MNFLKHAVLGLVALVCACLQLRAEEPAFAWQTDLEAARAQARKEDRPLLLVFR